MPSPRRGADGNREFLVHVRKQGRTGSPPVPVSDADLDAAVAGSGEASERGPSGPALGGEA
jgi:hypothetical protein